MVLLPTASTAAAPPPPPPPTQAEAPANNEKLRALEERLAALEAQGPGLLRVQRHCRAAGVESAVYKWVPADYYDRPMGARAALLGCFEEQMCKALLMENVDWQPLPPELGVAEDSALARRANSRYVCVILQYEAKMNAEKLRKAMHAHCNAALAAAGVTGGGATADSGMDASASSSTSQNINNGGGASAPSSSLVPLARFCFRLAPEDASDALTGFEHNAVTPFGLRTAGIPIVLSEATLSVQPRFLYMGAGHVNCKLGCTLHDFVRALDPIVANVSDPR